MLKPHLDVSGGGELLIGNISTTELADRFGTPLYIVDENRIRENYRNFREAFEELWDDVSIRYAYKANSNLAVCRVLQDEGSGAEVGSLCELKIALEVGTPPDEIIFSGNNKSEEELELSIRKGVLINVDSLQELELLGRITDGLGERARIALRVNPDVRVPTHPHISTGLRESKFGLDVPDGTALKAFERASEMENVIVESIHSHIGSQISETEPFVEQAEKMIKLRDRMRERTGIETEFVDLGGGLGVSYEPGESEVSPEEFASEIIATIEESVETLKASKPKLVLEPGRFIVSDASLLLGRVGYVKEREKTPDWISIDAGMNALLRPALYGSYHHIEVANRMNEEKTETVNVAGPLCESGDYLGKNRNLPKVYRGDLLAIYDVGAYGFSMSNQYLRKPRPAIVMVNSGKAEIVRKGERCEDLSDLEKIPGWLK